MTDIEYLDVVHRYPFLNPGSYPNQDVDRQAIINYNKALCEQYPFLMSRNVWTDEPFGDTDAERYQFTWLDDMPEGWRIAFGIQMCEEIKQALLRAQELDPQGGYENWSTNNTHKVPYLNGYRVQQIKEKYGTLHWYDNGAPEGVFDIINKYERLSEQTCIMCGQPAEFISTGWISPYCHNCVRKIQDDNPNMTDGSFITLQEYLQR